MTLQHLLIKKIIEEEFKIQKPIINEIVHLKDNCFIVKIKDLMKQINYERDYIQFKAVAF